MRGDGEDQPAAGSEGAAHLAERRLVVVDVLDHVEGDEGVELVAERDPASIHLEERRSGQPLPSPGEESDEGVGSNDGCAGEGPAYAFEDEARPATHLEHGARPRAV